MIEKHKPAMLEEVLSYLDIKEERVYVDGTFGNGGHSFPILKKIKQGKLIAFEWDKSSIKFANENNSFVTDSNFCLVNDNFANLAKHLDKFNINSVDGFLFDLGISSYQLFEEMRGFSYRLDSPLDMRINQDIELTAEKVINHYSQKDLADIFYYYGEERKAKIIAQKICFWRQKEKIAKTQQLVKIVASCFPQKKKKHPARRVFQALRIFINKELENLHQALETCISFLAKNGRLVVISYHSLEDRIVKQIFKKYGCLESYQLVTKKPLRPTEKEIESNHRIRSAKMRVLEKIS